MPQTTLLDIPHEEQAQMLAALRRSRDGYILAFHVLLLCGGAHPNRDCSRLVLLALQCLSHRVRLPWRHPRLDRRRGWDAGRTGAHHRPDAVAAPSECKGDWADGKRPSVP
jgi:hypothetical protein